jgi:hypothetical protein
MTSLQRHALGWAGLSLLLATVALASQVSARASSGVPVRTCRDSVYGDLGKNWRRNPGTIIVGPVAFPNIFAASSRESASTFAPRRGRYPAQKVLLVLARNTTVRLVIPADERRRLRLLYDPGAWNPTGNYRLSEGNESTVFHACATETQFNGGLIVAGPQCARVLVYVARQARPLAARLPFGRRCA